MSKSVLRSEKISAELVKNFLLISFGKGLIKINGNVSNNNTFTFGNGLLKNGGGEASGGRNKFVPDRGAFG